MRRIMTAVIAFVVVMAIASCGGSKNDAERLVKDFLKENLVEPDYKYIDFSDLDSTFYVNDSIVKAMREINDTTSVFKKGIKYAEGQDSRKKHFIHVSYRMGEKKVKQTFYLDDQLTRILSFKNDY